MRRNKYGNRKTVCDGITFDSMKEAKVYLRLKEMEKNGDIKSLKIQVKFDFAINGNPLRYVDSNRVIKYVADFEYFDLYGNRKVVDVKGIKTDVYKIKKALMLTCHNIFVEEI